MLTQDSGPQGGRAQHLWNVIIDHAIVHVPPYVSRSSASSTVNIVTFMNSTMDACVKRTS